MHWLLHHRPQISWIWPGIITILVAIIAIQNFAPNTWLTGWDTLHPEFNFERNFSSTFFGAWREDQGLGAPAAHSHMSELPRIAILWLLSAFLPVESLRYAYIFICLLLGPLGVYAFVRTWVTKEYSPLIRNGSAFLASLVYLFNLATMQQFFVIFEMFAVQFAALGWLFLFATSYLLQRNRKNLWLFGLTALLAAPIAYASLLWFATIGSLGVYLGGLSMVQKPKKAWLSLFALAGVTIAVNAYWLLPNLYFLLGSAAAYPAASHINRLFSEESFIHNRSYGDWKSVLELKNFLFSWKAFDASKNSFVPLFGLWKEHLQQPLVATVGFFAPLFALGGVLVGILKKTHKNAPASRKVTLALLPVVLLALFALININPPFTAVFSFLREHSALFAEGLRTPFTKFVFLFVFGLAVLAGLGVAQLFAIAEKEFENSRKYVVMGIVSFSLLLMLYCSPYFSGNLIAPKLRSTIPNAYFELFDWFATQPQQARIAQLPLPTYAGWEYYNWGYEGAGFIWFGLKQSVLVRDFDRWQPANESFYNQLSAAVYDQDAAQFSQILQTFDVAYVLVDESVVKPAKDQKILYLPEIASLLQQSDSRLVWQKDFLKVYAIDGTAGTNSFVAAPATATVVDAQTTYAAKNPLSTLSYTSVLSSGTAQQNSNPIIFPFSALLQPVFHANALENGAVTYTAEVTLSEEYALELPQLTKNEHFQTLATIAYTDDELRFDFSQNPTVTIDAAQEIALPHLQSFIVPIESTTSKLYLDINGIQFEVLKDGASVTKPLWFAVGQPTKLHYFDAMAARKNGVIVEVSPAVVQSVTIPETIWGEVTQVAPVELSAGSHSLKLSVPSEPILPNIYEQITLDNCNETKAGKIFKTVRLQTVTYAAQDDAIACEYLNDLDVHTSLSYLLHMAGTTEDGRGQKVYATDTANNRVVLEEMVPNGTFDLSYPLLKTGTSDAVGSWALSLETRAFRHVQSVNKLEQFALYPIPLEFLSEVQLIPKNPVVFARAGTIAATTKQGTYLYQAELADWQANAPLTLSQSYDPAWIAFPSNRPWQLLDHRTYNGWANAWIVPAGTTTVTMLFWPQLLSFFGYGVLIITLGWLMVAALRGPTKPTSHDLHRFVIRRFARLRARLLGR